jgi:hypothetical protein
MRLAFVRMPGFAATAEAWRTPAGGAGALLPDQARSRHRWEQILIMLDGMTPQIEDVMPGQAYLNIGGLERHYRDEDALGQAIIAAVHEASGLIACVGIGESKFLAYAAARSSPPGQLCIVPHGHEAEFVASLPIDLLPLPQTVRERLRKLGLERIGELARFSPSSLEAQFRAHGRRLWELANGIDAEPFCPRQIVPTVEGRLAFEEPVASVAVIVAAGRQILARLGPALQQRAARTMTIRAALLAGRSWERQFVFREAISALDRLTFILTTQLTNTPPPAPVSALELCLAGLTGETGRQIALGENVRARQQLAESIRQLKARYGASPIYRCVGAEPWSVIPENRHVLIESDV